MIVLGLNGGSPDLIERGVREGLLPGFERLHRQGAHGEVWSLTTSPPAEWTAHLAGVGPGQNGVEGYLGRRRIYQGIGRARTEELRVTTYPELLDEAGLSVGLLNLPPTYPPLELEHGFSVSGMLTPVDEDDYTRPSDLADQLSDYEIGVLYDDIRYSDYGERMYGLVREDLSLSLGKLCEDVMRVEQKRLDAARRLLDDRDPDLLVLLVSDLEALQRFGWHEVMEDSLEDAAIMQLYRAIDDFLLERLETSSDRPLLVCSGHGFQDQGPPEISSSEKTLWSRLRGTLGPLIPDGVKQTGLYARTYELVEGMLGRGSSSPPLSEEIPDGLMQTGFPSREGYWALRSPEVDSGSEARLRFLDLSVLVMHVLGQPVPEDYSGTLPSSVFRGRPDAAREAIDLPIDRGEPPGPGEDLRQKVLEDL